MCNHNTFSILCFCLLSPNFTLLTFSKRTHGKIKCPLCCEQVVAIPDWSQHRMECSTVNQANLNALPESSVPCSKCMKPLKLWPSNLEPKQFQCESDACPTVLKSKGSKSTPKAPGMLNDGTNMFCCFVCDVRFCSMCVNRMSSTNFLTARLDASGENTISCTGTASGALLSRQAYPV